MYSVPDRCTNFLGWSQWISYRYSWRSSVRDQVELSIWRISSVVLVWESAFCWFNLLQHAAHKLMPLPLSIQICIGSCFGSQPRSDAMTTPTGWAGGWWWWWWPSMATLFFFLYVTFSQSKVCSPDFEKFEWVGNYFIEKLIQNAYHWLRSMGWIINY